MTLVPAAAILVARRDAPVARRSSPTWRSRTSAAPGVWIALLTLAQHGAIGDPAALAAAGTGAQTLVAVAALVGFGTKAGLVPLHSWLPRAHPVAPAHLSALMSGVMIKVALYGLIRVEFEWLGATPRWLGITLLALGLLSALGGVLWALVQHDLKRLLAFHSIENVGIIALGARRLAALRPGRRARVGGDRVRGCAAARRQPRALQGAAVPRRRRVRARGRRARARPAGWAAAPDAVDGRRVPRGLDGDRRAAAAERLRFGVADAAVAAARRAGAAGRAWRSPARLALAGAGGDRRAGAAVLREGRRARAAGRATAPGVRDRDGSPAGHARRDGGAAAAVRGHRRRRPG